MEKSVAFHSFILTLEVILTIILDKDESLLPTSIKIFSEFFFKVWHNNI